jgi:PPM family protein phosphatase
VAWAAVELHTGPARTRRRATVPIFDGMCAVFEVTDSPPGWFTVSELDLQPALIGAVDTALGRELGSAIALASPELAARHLLEAVHRDLAALASGNMLYRGSIAEGVLAVATERGAAIAWVGTARGYRVGARGITQLTRDHDVLTAWIEQRRADGQPATPQEIDAFPHRGIITRALGAPGVVEVDTVAVALEPGERIVLASPSVGELPDSLEPSSHELAVAIAHEAARRSPGRAIGVAVGDFSAPAPASRSP